MTPAGPSGARTRRPRVVRGGVPAAQIARQAWATRGTIATCLVVVALVSCLASVAPRLLDRATTAELRTSVDDTTLVVSVPEDDSQMLELQPDTADQVASKATQITRNLPATVSDVVASPVASLVGPELGAGGVDDLPVVLRLAYLADVSRVPDGGVRTRDVTERRSGAVTWVTGGPPSTPVTSRDVARAAGPTLPVEIGVSTEVADLLDLDVGDVLPVHDPDGTTLDTKVTGVFQPVDPTAHAWTVAPTAIAPREVPGSAGRVEVTALTSATSLPAARYDLHGPHWTWSVTFPVVPDALDAHKARGASAAIAALAAAPSRLGLPGRSPTVTTRIDRLLDGAMGRVSAATAQAALVLSGVVATALLALVLATTLLVRRRSSVLAHQRTLGASLGAIAVAATLESIAVTATGTAVGLAAAEALVPGPVPWGWVAPPLAIAGVLIPALAVRGAARNTAPPPARRLDTRSARGAALRRPAIEATLILLASATLTVLRARGARSAAGTLGADLVVVAAPVLVAGAVAILLLRVLPPLARWWRRVASRTLGPVPLVAGARTRVGAASVLALVLVTALLTVVLAVRATVDAGRVAGSWTVVGGDATLTARAGASLPESLVDDLRGLPGVTAATTADVADGTQVLGTGTDVSARLVAIDSRSAAALLAATPLPDGPALGALDGTDAQTPPGTVRVLADGLPSGAAGLRLRWAGETVPIEVVGPAPWLPGAGSTPRVTVVVDRAQLAAALGEPVPATLAWIAGPGAAAAAEIAGSDASVTTRDGWLAHLRGSPITTAFDGLLTAAAAILAVLGLLVVALAAATGAPERTRVLVGLRVLGLPRREGGRLVVAELVGPVLGPALAGIATGIGLSLAVVGPLGLESLTGQTGPPSLVLPWWVGLSVIGLGATVAMAAAVERPRAGRERLSQVMREG